MNRGLSYIGVTPVQLIWTVFVLIVGWIAARIISSIFRASLRKTGLPELLAEFLTKMHTLERNNKEGFNGNTYSACPDNGRLEYLS